MPIRTDLHRHFDLPYNQEKCLSFQELKAYKLLVALNHLCCQWALDIISLEVDNNMLVTAEVSASDIFLTQCFLLI